MEGSHVIRKDGYMPTTDNFKSYVIRCEKLYISHKASVTGQNEYLICNMIGLTHTEYKKTMMEKFNAKINKYEEGRFFTILHKGALYFEKTEDVEKALDWLESMVIMKELNKVIV